MSGTVNAILRWLVGYPIGGLLPGRYQELLEGVWESYDSIWATKVSAILECGISVYASRVSAQRLAWMGDLAGRNAYIIIAAYTMIEGLLRLLVARALQRASGTLPLVTLDYLVRGFVYLVRRVPRLQ